MPSIIALAGVVGLAAAAFAPQYDNDFRATTTLAAAPQYGNDFRTTTLAAAVPTPYVTPVNARPIAPVYNPVEPFVPEEFRFNTSLVWSTTKYIRTSAFTTFCPEPTTLTFSTRTYTVTTASTLTVTDCYNGCEVVRPLPTTTVERPIPVIRTTTIQTFIPAPTTITLSASTFTVTQATTLTIPQNISTTSVFRTVIPVQPTVPVYHAPINSTFRAPVPTYAPVKPVPTFDAPVAPAPAPTFEAPVQPIEPFIPSTTTLNAIVPPYPTGPSRIVAPSGTGAFTTSPALYTGAANRVGAGALMAVAGFAVLL